MRRNNNLILILVYLLHFNYSINMNNRNNEKKFIYEKGICNQENTNKYSEYEYEYDQYRNKLCLTFFLSGFIGYYLPGSETIPNMLKAICFVTYSVSFIAYACISHLSNHHKNKTFQVCKDNYLELLAEKNNVAQK